MVKRPYTQPALIEYGRIEQLTLGQHGTSPDYNQGSTHYVNDNCDPTNSGPGGSGNSNPFTCGTS